MSDQKHWLVRPGTIRILWMVFIVVLALTIVPEFGVDLHPHFGVDGIFGFHAWYGFLTCCAMVVAAKVLGIFLKREDTYYDD